MTSIPSNVARVPTLLTSQVASAQLGRTGAALFRASTQLATGKAIQRVSDDPVKAATVSFLDQRLEASQQRLRNLSHASSAMGVIDSTLAQINDLLLSGKTIAQEQINFGSSAGERSQQAAVVQSLIDGLLRHANQDTVAGYLFAGAAAGTSPVVELLGGYRSRAVGDGLFTDLGAGASIPLSLGATNPVVGSTARVPGTVPLDPELTPDTRLADLAGARGLGVTTGIIEFSIDGSDPRRIDLSTADTIADVTTRLTAAIRQFEADTGRTILGSGGVSATDAGISIDVAPATAGPDPVITFTDVGIAHVAADLGLRSADASLTFSPASEDALALAPRLTWLTPIAALGAVDGTLGSIRLTNGGLTRVVNLSAAETVQDLKRLIEAENLGVRVEIDPDTATLQIIQELATPAGQGLSILDVDDNSAGGAGTASALGIRTFAAGTRLSAFNDGNGVGIITNGKDPITGLPDPARDIDFVITLGDGTQLSIDLQPQHLVTVQTLLDAINTQAAPQLAAASLPPTAFEARLSTESGGIELWQDTAVSTLTGPIRIESRNGSRAALDLGLLEREYDPSTGTYLSEDRSRVRSLNAFASLLDLREALENNDSVGIGLAGERLEEALDALSRTRGLFGGYDRRVADLTRGEEDRQLLDETIRSELQDADFAEVASRYSLLQTQLQAGYRVVSETSRMSLLDYL